MKAVYPKVDTPESLPLSLYHAIRFSQRTTLIKLAAWLAMVAEGSFVARNLVNGYLDPVPTQLGIIAGSAISLVVLRFAPRSDIPGHLFLAVIVTGCLVMSFATQDAIRFIPWWCVAIVCVYLFFKTGLLLRYGVAQS
jgi:hypothetical protein